jgi:hypothetical protein
MIAAWVHADAQPSPDSRRANQATPRATVLAAFQTDIAVCRSITKIMKTDRRFIQSFSSAANRDTRGVESFLRESPNAKSEDFQYVLRNLEYFDIDVANHGDPWAVAWVEGEGIYCAPSFGRLKAIENLGESAQAWEVRKFFLDKALQALEHPVDREMAGGGQIEFDKFKALVLEADKRYSRAQRPMFRAWTRAAIKIVESGRSRIDDGAAGLSAAEQNKILDEWVRFLRRIANR